jgi:hypothetical protein
VKYEDAIFGYEEPEQMWLTGSSALELMKLSSKAPFLDAQGNPVDETQTYYLSKETGLIPSPWPYGKKWDLF